MPVTPAVLRRHRRSALEPDPGACGNDRGVTCILVDKFRAVIAIPDVHVHGGGIDLLVDADTPHRQLAGLTSIEPDFALRDAVGTPEVGLAERIDLGVDAGCDLPADVLVLITSDALGFKGLVPISSIITFLFL